MVNTNDLVRLWQYYDEQSNTPFTGHEHAKFLANRIDAVLNSPDKTKLLRQLPKSASEAVSVIEGMNDVEFDAFLKGIISSSDIPACQTSHSGQPEPNRPSLDDLWYYAPQKADIGLRKHKFVNRAKELGYTDREIDYYFIIDPPTYTIIKEFKERENRWFVIVQRRFSVTIIDKILGVYAYESQADAVIKAQSFLDEKTLKELWTYL